MTDAERDLEKIIPGETITEHLQRIIPHGERCDGCSKGDPHGIQGYSGDVFCHLQEEVMVGGDKGCGFNDPRCAAPEGGGGVVNWTIHTQTSAAFDNDMRRDPSRDDWKSENVGVIPKQLLPEFCRNRYPEALRIVTVPADFKEGRPEVTAAD